MNTVTGFLRQQEKSEDRENVLYSAKKVFVIYSIQQQSCKVEL